MFWFLIADALSQSNRNLPSAMGFGLSQRSFARTEGDPAEGAGGGSGGGAGAAAGAPGTATPPPPNPDLIPRAEAKRAFKERDDAKKAARQQQAMVGLLAEALGIDASGLELVETGNADNPFELKGDALEQVTSTLKSAQQARLDAQKKAGKWEDREKELNETWTKKVQKAATEAEGKAKTAVDAAGKRVSALETWINDTAGRSEIRSALIAENAVHDGNGNYDELIDLVERRVKREIAVDEETGKARVSFTPTAEDGTPMLNAKNQPASVREMVADWLGKRPQFKAAKARSGPGAGGNAPGGSRPGGASERGRQAAAMIFGKSPEAQSSAGK